MFSRILRTATTLPTFKNTFLFSPKKPYIEPKVVSETRDEKSKSFMYINIAIMSFMFGICFAGIPLYRRFCEKMGLVGDQEKKEYDFTGQKSNCGQMQSIT